jgi:hypothetical protein
MSNYTRNNLTGDLAPVNAELQKVQQSIADKLDRKPTTGQANQLESTLDANNHRIINLPTPSNPNDVVRLKDLASSQGNSLIPPQGSQIGKFLRTDGTTAYWDSVTKIVVGLSAVDNTSDANKPVSSAQQTALDLKANNTDISNVDNTSDVNKPVSTAQQTALNLKGAVEGSTTALIGSSSTYSADTVVITNGFTTSGDGGNGRWKQNGVTGQTVSQKPAQLNDGLLNDGLGNQWQLVPSIAGVFITSLGATTAAVNSHLEIQAAINFCKRLNINLLLIPEGNFRLGVQLTVTHTLLVRGGGSSSTAFFSTHSGNSIVFQSETAGSDGAYLNGGGIEGINVTRIIASSGGVGVWFRQCNGLRAVDVAGSNHDFGFRISGGQLNTIDRCRSFCSSPYPGELAQDSAGIVMEKADIGGGSVQDCYTVAISNWYSSSNKLQKYGILVHSADGLSIVNTYTGFYESSNIRFKRKSTTDTITAVQITNSYFDCVGPGGSPFGFVCLNDAAIAGEEGGRSVKFVNCFFGNNNGSGNPLIRIFSHINRLTIDASTFGFTDNSAIRISDAAGASFGVYNITNNCFNGTNLVSTSAGAISATDAKRLSVTGNDFGAVGTICVVTSGTFEGIVVADNAKEQATQMITEGTATYAEQFIRNLGDSDGRSISFTPTLEIGGVAITAASYSIRTGQYSLNSGVVTFHCRIAITSKESQTGLIGVSGLPILCNSNTQSLNVIPGNTDTDSSGIYSQIIGTTNKIEILKGSITSSTAVDLLDTDIFNTFNLKVSGSYFTD